MKYYFKVDWLKLELKIVLDKLICVGKNTDLLLLVASLLNSPNLEQLWRDQQKVIEEMTDDLPGVLGIGYDEPGHLFS